LTSDAKMFCRAKAPLAVLFKAIPIYSLKRISFSCKIIELQDNAIAFGLVVDHPSASKTIQ